MYPIPGRSCSPLSVYLGALHDKAKMPVGKEIIERKRCNLHLLSIDRHGLPHRTIFVHLSAARAAASTKIECFGTQEEFLDEFLGK